jgi:hypothetical protein
LKFHSLFASAAVVASLAYPLAAQAQGIPDGVAHGAYVGSHDAGPVGAVVGGAVGGVLGGIEGALGMHPAVYSEGPPPRRIIHRRWVRHSYRRNVRHATG